MKVAKMLAVLAVLGIAGSAFAQGRGGRGGDPNMRPLMGQIVKVEEGKITVKPMMVRPGGDANAVVVVTTNDKTTVTIDGKDAKVADLKADLYVIVTPREGTAEKIVATTTKPEPPSRPSRGRGNTSATAPAKE
jgi:hypothetical protein